MVSSSKETWLMGWWTTNSLGKTIQMKNHSLQNKRRNNDLRQRAGLCFVLWTRLKSLPDSESIWLACVVGSLEEQGRLFLRCSQGQARELLTGPRGRTAYEEWLKKTEQLQEGYGEGQARQKESWDSRRLGTHTLRLSHSFPATHLTVPARECWFQGSWNSESHSTLWRSIRTFGILLFFSQYTKPLNTDDWMLNAIIPHYQEKIQLKTYRGCQKIQTAEPDAYCFPPILTYLCFLISKLVTVKD